MPPARGELITAAVAALAAVAAVAFAVFRSHAPAMPRATAAPTIVATATPSSSPPGALVDPNTIAALTTLRPTTVRSAPDPDAATLTRLRAGILLPVTARQEAFLAVLTPCEARGWVALADVRPHHRAAGMPRTLAEATIVVDPGHGGQLTGAVGPGGTPEKTPNVDIARRLGADLAPARVFLTRNGDFTAGLNYRAAIANALAAHVFVSVHNNADPDEPSSGPGTETYYQHASAPSKRLAGLLYEQVVRSVRGYGVSWVADRDAGAKYRLNAGGGDYYALLRAVRVPAVIAENLYLSNAPEEALLRRPDVRAAIAGALAAGVRRFLETDEPGSGFVTPLPRPPGPSGRLPRACIEPGP